MKWLRKFWEIVSPNTTLARTTTTEIVGWKYTVPLLIFFSALLALYYFMDWELT